MGRLDWARTCFAMQGNQHSASRADEIMAKYRPIAPKPPLHTTSKLGKPASDSISALGFHSTFNTTHKRNNIVGSCNGGHNRSGQRRRASDCFQGRSPRVLKKSRGPNIPTEVKNTHEIVFPSVKVDGPEIIFPSAQTSCLDKELEAVERTAANAFDGSSVWDEKYVGSDQWVDIKVVMKSIGEVGLENPVSNVEPEPVPKVAESQCGCGSVSFFVFPIVSDIREQEEVKNLVTLPLLPPKPLLQKGSVLSSSASNASCGKQDIPLRLFGKDFSHKEVGSCQINNIESPKPKKNVPIVGLSFV